MNPLAPTPANALVRLDPYGRIKIGGPVTPREVLYQTDPHTQVAAQIMADVLPGSAQERSLERLNALADERQYLGERPIRNVLNAGEMALEGGGLLADLWPGLKSLGIATASLIPLMARRSDPLSRLAKLAKRQQGLIGYHGSPYKFTRFDHSRMGTGEGAQAYGWGTYIAEDPNVAGHYNTSLSNTHVLWKGEQPNFHPDLQTPEASAGIALIKAFGDVDNAIHHAQKSTQSLAPRVIDWIEANRRHISASNNGNLYTVDLPDEKIAQMLDWDAPLSEQPESVQAALSRFTGVYQDADGAWLSPGDTVTRFKHKEDALDYAKKTGNMDARFTDGQSIYQYLSQYSGGDQAASEALRELGIPGIKYFDGNSRSAGEGTRNFVVFDENDMTILTRNGERVGADLDYRIDHTAPLRDGLNTLDDATDIFGDDIYNPSVSWRYFGHGGDAEAMDKGSAQIIAGFRGEPNKPVTIYRAVPKGVTDINKGDWVTINRQYADEHGYRHIGDEYDIIEKRVTAKDIATDGNSIHEWGYDPQ